MKLLDRAVHRLVRWHSTSLARRAYDRALYGDYQYARELIDHAARHGGAALVPIAGAWADAYLAATPTADVELVTPLDKWLAELLTAHANHDHAEFAALITEVRPPLVRHHLEALLRMAALAQLRLDDPEPTWP